MQNMTGKSGDKRIDRNKYKEWALQQKIMGVK